MKDNMKKLASESEVVIKANALTPAEKEWLSEVEGQLADI
jgi:hypothetical protein